MTPGTPEDHGTPDQHGRSADDAAAEAALERLRRADPARDAQVDMAALRAAVDRRIGTPGSAADDDAAPGTDAAPGAVGAAGAAPQQGEDDDGAPARAYRSGPRRGWVVAAAVAAMLAVGTGGYIAGTQRGPTFDSAADHAAPESVQMTDDAGEAPARPESEPQGDPGLDGDAAGDAQADRAAPGGLPDTSAPPLAVEFLAEGLSEEPGAAEAWALDAGAVDGERAVAELAAAVGISGTPQPAEVTPGALQEVAWAIQDSGRSWTVVDDAFAGAHYRDETARPAQGEPAPAQPQDVAREFLGTIGTDVAALRFTTGPPEASEAQDAIVRVDAVPAEVADGVPAGQPFAGAGWTLLVSDRGVVRADGTLAEPVGLGEHPVISPADAVQRLADEQFGARFHGPASADRHAPAGPPAQDPGSGAIPPAPGAPLPWAIHQVRLQDAELTLGAYADPQAGALLLPTWHLRDDQGRVWSVLAVDEDALDIHRVP